MKKRIILLSLVFVLVFSMTSFADNTTKISIDNEYVQFNDELGYPFIDENSRTQVPFRATMECFGATVGWNNDTHTAIAEKDGIKIEVPIGQKHVFRNGEKLENDTAALIKDSRTYLPIRAVLEAFGANVGWDGENRCVLVDTEKNEIVIHFIDVGQGDSIFIDYGEYDILIDAGENSCGSNVANYLKSLNVDDIEIMVATHEHSDHIGGLDDVLVAFEVEKVIDSGESYDTKTYKDYMNAVESESDCELLYDEDMTFDLGDGIEFKVIELGDDYSNTNDNSVITMLSYDDVEILFTGDLESDVEDANLNKFSDIDILKVGHHGSNTATSDKFLNVTKPEYAVISCGVDNKYDHPHTETLEKLQKANVEVFRTDKQGTIICTTDGKNISWNTFSMPAIENNNPITVPVVPTIPAVTPKVENEGNVTIKVDDSAEIVTITNNSTADVNMTGWKIISVNGNQVFDFTNGYIIKASSSIMIASGSASGDIVWTTKNIWNNSKPDEAQLYNSSGVLVSSDD